MSNQNLAKQYNNFAETFTDFAYKGKDETLSGLVSRNKFYEHLDFIKPGIKLLDIGCGGGEDLLYYRELGASVFGLDSSDEMVKLAQKSLPDGDIRLADFANIPFDEETFDAVLSKYALQTAMDLNGIFLEINRILKPGGVLLFLVTHPLRQFMERNDEGDYFKQVVVESRVFQEQMVFKEPTHTFNEYLSKEFFEHFDIKQYEECFDPSAEKLENKRYPGFFILKALKR